MPIKCMITKKTLKYMKKRYLKLNGQLGKTSKEKNLRDLVSV